MPRLKVTEDDFDKLTDEERVGLKEFQAELEAEAAAEDAEIAAAAAGEPEDKPAPKPKKKEAAPPAPDPDAGAEDAPAAEDEDEDEDEPEGEDADDSAEEGESEEGEEGEEGEEAEDDEEDTPPIAAGPPAVPPAPKLTDVEEKRLVDIKKELKDLAKQFDDGELTAVEWRESQEKLEDERDALKEKRAIAAMSVQTAVNTWYYSTIPLFMAQHTEYAEGSLRHKLLDTVVRELQTGSENPTDPKILIDAHAKIIKELGAVNGAEKPAKKKKVNGDGNGAKRVTPPSFAAIPASDQQQVVLPNKFARLEKLKGADYEKALAKLSPADREMYLQGG